jgi:hypothetical protein
VSGQPQLKLAKSTNPTISGTLTATVSSSSPVASKTFGLDNVPPSAPDPGTKVQLRRVLLNYDFVDLTGTLAGTSQTLFRGAGAADGGVGGITYKVAFQVSGNTVATATLPDEPSPGVTVSGLGNFATYDVEVTAVEDALGNKQTLSTPIAAGTFQLADAPITLSSVTVSNTTPNAGGTFNVSYTASGGFGSLTPGIALKLGNKLVRIGTPGSTTAYFGAQYVLYVVDSAGNFAVADLPVTVSQPASDKTPPAITVSLPSSVAPSGTISVSGTHSDPPNTLQISRSHGSLGGFEWYLATSTPTTFTSGSYSFSVTAPNYTGPVGVVVLGWDAFNNLGSATGTVNVQ